MTKSQGQNRSRGLFATARKYMPGGVSSPVRAFQGVGCEPLVIASGRGCHVRDVDGNDYIDYVGAYGPLIAGHAHPDVIAAMTETAKDGTAFGATTEKEIDLARTICQAIPSVESVRFVNSGTEATMSAVRLARAYTGRDKIVRFEGCYHGHADGLISQAGSGLATLGLPSSPGVPTAFLAESLVAPYNDLTAVEAMFHKFQDSIAAVIVEPVAANMGVVPATKRFLDGLCSISRQAGALLIFDEVITGFRLCYGGSQELHGIRPDLTCLGKIIGGGLPIGAYGGRQEIMEMVSPAGPVYQAGTLSGNPLAAAVGLATLRLLRDGSSYARLEERSLRLSNGLRCAAADAGIPAVVNCLGSLLSLFLTDGPIVDYASAQRSDSGRYARFFSEMLAGGVYLPPSQFEAIFVSLAHGDEEIDRTIEIAEKAIRRCE